VEVADDRQLRHVAQEALDAPVCPGVRDDARAAAGALERDRVLDDVGVLRPAAVAVADEQPEALPLVDLDRGDQEVPRTRSVRGTLA
jgi:hypothetical protein